MEKMVSIIFLFVIMLLVACSGQEKGELTRVNVQKVDAEGEYKEVDTSILRKILFISNDEMGIVLEGIDVSDIVLKAAKEKVQKDFDIATEYFPDYGYSNWRIKSLDYNYTYEELGGQKLVIYQLNYEFLSESPENIVIAGGMYITEDNWVMPSYPNSTYLIFQQEDDTLSYLNSVMINDSYPGHQLFTDDLHRVLQQSKAD